MQYSSESVEALVEQFMRLPTIGRKTAQRLVSYVLKMPRTEVVEIAKALIAVKDRVKQCSVCHNVTDNDPCPICASPRRDHSVICVVEDANDVMALERMHEYRGVYHVLGGVISPLDGIGPEDLNIRPLVARIDPEFGKITSGNGAHQASRTGSSHADGARQTPETASSGADDAAQASETASPGVEGAPQASGTTSFDVDGPPQAEESASSIADESAGYNARTPISEVILALNPTVEGDTTAYYISQLLKPHDIRLTRIARGLPIGGDLEYADEATLARALEGRSAI